MPRTETTIRTLLTFSELSPERQQAAIDYYRENYAADDADTWSDEWRGSMDGAREAFNFKDAEGRNAWNAGYPGTYRTVDTDPALPENEETGEPVNLKGVRAWKWAVREWLPLIESECPWTGYCGDEAFLAPMRKFLASPSSFDSLESVLEDCASSFVKAWESDIDYCYEDDTIRDRLSDGIDEWEWNAGSESGRPV